MIQRPSKKELLNKIREAKDAALKGRIEIVDAVSLAADAIELEYDVGTELAGMLYTLLNDISADQYAGQHPPMKSYEAMIKNMELFSFVVNYKSPAVKVYLKFALAEESLWLVSLHKDRP